MAEVKSIPLQLHGPIGLNSHVEGDKVEIEKIEQPEAECVELSDEDLDQVGGGGTDGTHN
jgi:hypothetical protein